MLGGIGRRRLLTPLCAAALLGGGLLGGCGGDDDESAAEGKGAREGKDIAAYSAAAEPPTVFIQRVARLLETAAAKKDCAEIEDVNRHSLTRFACPAAKPLRESMAEFEVVGAEEYGTGAVVDYESGGVADGATIVLFVAPDRKWGISRFGVVTPSSTETSDDEHRDGYTEAVEEYLAAVRARDCEAFEETVFVPAGSTTDVCKTVFLTTAELGQRLKDYPSAKLKYEGGNATYGFFSIETRSPTVQNVTISVLATGDSSKPYAVLDAAPSPSAESQELIRRQFEQQQKQPDDDGGDQPETSPSRKAS